MTDFDIEPHVDEVTGLVRAASRRALEWFRRPHTIDNKAAGSSAGSSQPAFDPVTEADRVVERQLRAELAARFPEHQILGEEDGVSGEGACRWIIDPIDGTRAFVSGQPMWGTLLGFQVGDEVRAGWLHQPTLDETYVGSPVGARLLTPGGARPLTTSSITDLGDAILLCTHPSMFAPGDEQAAFERVSHITRMTRFGGDCLNFASVAAGFADLVIENQLQPYDVIPLIPIIERAGGIITDRHGNAPLAGGWVVASASRELHQQALRHLDG